MNIDRIEESKKANELIDEIINSSVSEKLLLTKSEARDLALINVKNIKKSIQKSFNNSMNYWLEVERQLKKK